MPESQQRVENEILVCLVANEVESQGTQVHTRQDTRITGNRFTGNRFTCSNKKLFSVSLKLLSNKASSVLVTTSKAPVPSSVALVTTSKALVTSSDALVPSSNSKLPWKFTTRGV